MAFNGSGVFSLIYNWENDAANGIKILASRMDTQETDIATNGLSLCITKDGQQTTTMGIPFAQGISVTNGTKSDTIWQTSRNAYTNFTLSSPTGTASASSPGKMMGLGSSWVLTPSFSGRVSIRLYGDMTDTGSSANGHIMPAYGTGSAPANGDAGSGTQMLSAGGITLAPPVASRAAWWSIEAEITGLTLSTAYWFDLQLWTGSGGTIAVDVRSVIIEEF